MKASENVHWRVLNVQIPLAVSTSVHREGRNLIVESVADFCGVGWLEVKVGNTGSRLGTED